MPVAYSKRTHGRLFQHAIRLERASPARTVSAPPDEGEGEKPSDGRKSGKTWVS